jgi:hypothetical protein
MIRHTTNLVRIRLLLVVVPFSGLFPLHEVASVGDFVLSHGIVGIFLHYIGSRTSLCSFSSCDLFPCLLFNIKRSNETLNRDLLPTVFQRSSKVPPCKRKLTNNAPDNKLVG